MNATVSLKNHIGNFLDGIANAISLEPERRSYVAPRNGAVRDAAAMRKDFVITIKGVTRNYKIESSNYRSR